MPRQAKAQPVETAAPASNPDAVLWLLSYAISKRGLRTLGQLRDQFNIVIARAGSEGHAEQCPTREQFDTATSEFPETTLLADLDQELRRKA